MGTLRLLEIVAVHACRWLKREDVVVEDVQYLLVLCLFSTGTGTEVGSRRLKGRSRGCFCYFRVCDECR